MKKTSSESTENLIWDLAVIGGGPAGMMAAGRAAQRGLKVILLEKNEGLGKKLLITGGGRCNVTNGEYDDRVLLAKFKDSAKFLFSAFSQHSVQESMDFFHSKDMPTKEENDKRIFPLSNTAKSVWEVMVKYMKDGKVTVRSDAAVARFVQSTPGHIDALHLKNGEVITARSFVLATGGKSHPETGSTGDGFKWLEKMGHTVIEPSVSLVPITASDSWVHKLSGFSLPNAKVTLFQNGVKQGGKNASKKGKVLFTHVGLSGPAILNMSSEIGELLKYGEVILSLDLLPEHDYATLNAALQKLFAKDSNKMFKNAISALIPSSLIPAVLEKSNIDPETPLHSVTREERLLLVKVLKDMHIHPTGLLGTDKAIITSGGIALEELDFKTMRSKRIDNLYVVGDLLNIDRPSGGYSLQLCWTTGWVAGNATPS
ncbi:MAG: aminoacetone oxidase family FAD-binding enzyme [Patescibacteria group bacterium]